MCVCVGKFWNPYFQLGRIWSQEVPFIFLTIFFYEKWCLYIHQQQWLWDVVRVADLNACLWAKFRQVWEISYILCFWVILLVSCIWDIWEWCLLRLYEISRCLALGTPALLIYSVKYCYKFVFFHERIGFLVLKELQDQLQAKRKELEEFRAKAREKSLK